MFVIVTRNCKTRALANAIERLGAMFAYRIIITAFIVLTARSNELLVGRKPGRQLPGGEAREVDWGRDLRIASDT